MQRFLSTPSGQAVSSHLHGLHPRQAYSLVCVVAIGQEHVLRVLPTRGALSEALEYLSSNLAHVEEFYDSIGGLAGYQLQCLQLIEEHKCQDSTSSTPDARCRSNDVEYLVPSGLDLAKDTNAAAEATARGLAGLPQMAEIYPLGGAGDRLGLCCEKTGDSLPTAVLPYVGRTLLEVLMRDLQAREYLYYKVYGKQVTTPVAVMTSAVKGNHWRVQELFRQAHWFGRGHESFRLFPQPLVPVIAADNGQWLMDAPLEPIMKPGGHGVIWKLMLDAGVFDWLERSNRTSAIVRQISNPMAGQDTTLLALSGEGLRGSHAFGFASCERVVGAAEGMNVMLKRQLSGFDQCSYHITNLEYTEFERLGIEDKGATEGSEYSAFPANTNVLFLGLKKIEAKVRESVEAGTTDAILPGMILNLKKETTHRDLERGIETRTKAGRLECTMQNLADCFGVSSTSCTVPSFTQLDTFMVYGPRRKVTSSAKRQRNPGSTKIHQTPDGSLYDLLHNASDMMTQAGMEMPPLGSVREYLDNGPGYLFFFHPALGPLWSVVGQKIRGGRMASRSEVQLEVAEAEIQGLDVDGSFLVLADSVLGHFEEFSNGPAEEEGRRLVFSDRCGRVRMHNVKIRNAGIDWSAPDNVYWRHRVSRKESCRIVLHGTAEFEATDVILQGDVTYEVPDGYRMRVTSAEGADGEQPHVDLCRLDGTGPTWRWEYFMTDDGAVELSLHTKSTIG